MPIDNVICNARVDVFYALKTFIAKGKQTSVSKLAESKEGKAMNKGHVLYREQNLKTASSRKHAYLHKKFILSS